MWNRLFRQPLPMSLPNTFPVCNRLKYDARYTFLRANEIALQSINQSIKFLFARYINSTRTLNDTP